MTDLLRRKLKPNPSWTSHAWTPSWSPSCPFLPSSPSSRSLTCRQTLFLYLISIAISTNQPNQINQIKSTKFGSKDKLWVRGKLFPAFLKHWWCYTHSFPNILEFTLFICQSGFFFLLTFFSLIWCFSVSKIRVQNCLVAIWVKFDRRLSMCLGNMNIRWHDKIGDSCFFESEKNTADVPKACQKHENKHRLHSADNWASFSRAFPHLNFWAGKWIVWTRCCCVVQYSRPSSSSLLYLPSPSFSH